MRKRGNARRCHQGGIHYADISFTNTNDKLTNILGTVQKKNALHKGHVQS